MDGRTGLIFSYILVISKVITSAGDNDRSSKRFCSITREVYKVETLVIKLHSVHFIHS